MYAVGPDQHPKPSTTQNNYIPGQAYLNGYQETSCSLDQATCVTQDAVKGCASQRSLSCL